MTEDFQGLSRGSGFGRGGGAESFARRREEAQRRVSSSRRQAELVESALRGLEEQLVSRRVADADGQLRATARAMLVVAYASDTYDVAFAPAHGHVAVRIRHTEFGLEADLVELGGARP